MTDERQDITRGKKAPPFAPGDPNHTPGPGRPKQPRIDRGPATPEEVRKLLFSVMDVDTSKKMVMSLRKKIGKANITALEFVMAYLIGKPAVTVQHTASESLQQFITAWSDLVMAPGIPTERTISDRSQVIEGDFAALGDDPAAEPTADAEDGAPEEDDEDSEDED